MFSSLTNGLRGGRLGGLLLLCIAFGLRMWRLGQDELWFDEAGSAFIARKTLPAILAYSATAISEHPPLYYTILHIWMSVVGESEFALRFLSSIFGMLFAVVLGRIGHEMGGRALAFAALAVGAVAPFPIAYAQETRMYSLVMLLAALLLLGVQRLLRQRSGLMRHLALIVVVSTLGIATSYFFIPVVVAAGFVLLLRGRGLPRPVRGTVAAATGIALLAVLIVALLPGPRATILALLKISGTAATYLPKIVTAMGDISGERLDGQMAPALAFGATWLWAGVGAWAARRYALPLWPFLLSVLVLAVPLPVLDGRYFSAAIPALYIAMAVALSVLVRRPALAVLIFPLLVFSLVYPLVHHYDRDYGHFGEAFLDASRYVRDENDTLILTEPDAWPLVDYYRVRTPRPPRIEYIPVDRDVSRLTNDIVERHMEDLVPSTRRIVLGPVTPQNRDPDSLMENALLRHAFAVSRTFYPDSTLVALFVTPRPLTTTLTTMPLNRDLTLEELSLSALDVTTGEPVLARLLWRPGRGGLPRATVTLQLQDEQGRLWASQQTEPCNGWCATDMWEPGMTVTDNRAIIIPSDVPAGAYTLVLRLDTNQGSWGDPLPLGTVNVKRGPVAEAPLSPPLAVRAGVEIRDLSLAPRTARAGDALQWEAQWLPTQQAMTGWQVRWELLQGNSVIHQWQEAPSTSLYPSDTWSAGQPMRGIGSLVLPGSLHPGVYDVRLRLVGSDGASLAPPLPVASITLVDRPRSFVIPDIGQATDVAWQQGVRLKRVELPGTVTHDGGLPVSLVWQASGPLDRSYKLFVQLRDASGQIVGQQDIYPANGGALSNTWAENEVIIDKLSIEIAPDAPTGVDYRVVVGWYHLESGERLPLVAGGDEYELGSVRLLVP